MNYLHDRGLDRLLKDINQYPERTINMDIKDVVDRITSMAQSTTEATKRVIKEANLSPLQEGIAINAAVPIFETAMKHIVALKRLGIPIYEAKGAVLVAIMAAHAMIESANLSDPEQSA